MEKKKLFYTMGEVAELFDVNQSLIRYWDKEFSILKPVKSSDRGHRLFRPQDVEAFRLIYHLTKEKGMTLSGAKLYIAQRKLDPVAKDISVIERLENIKALLTEVLDNFKEEHVQHKVMYQDTEDELW
ncbi:MAG: MerR family transcriptional regulator [Rikenellaceae bacterium]